MSDIPPVLASWDSESIPWSADEVGGKAVGLFALPRSWTPPFLVVTRSFVSTWTSVGSAEQAFQAIASSAADAVRRLISVAAEMADPPGILVRSNASDEQSNEQRGAYESLPVAASFTAVCNGLDQILSQRDDTGQNICGVLQAVVVRRRGGHLSNERRVTERRTVWIGEDLDADGERIGSPYSIDARSALSSLEAPEGGRVRDALRAVAHAFTDPNDRYLCEWVWDGARVWVVQRDRAARVDNPVLLTYLRKRGTTRTTDRSPVELGYIRPVSVGSTHGWSKSGRPVTFDALQMPTAPVFLLEGTQFNADVERGLNSVRADVSNLLRNGPVVVRCDVRTGSGAESLSLPTSDPLVDATTVIDWMTRQAQAFAGDGLADYDWAFLPANLVPARASVMVHAQPGGLRATLNALWGFPDGVGLLPHDTWIHYVLGDGLVELREFKGDCLTFESDNGWQFSSVPEPFDWGHVLNREEALIASSWARRLADHLQREVELMILARIAGARGASAMLPWHYTDYRVPVPSRPIPSVPKQNILTIRRRGDLPDESSQFAGIYLKPVVEERRDRSFLQAVGSAAATAGVPVYFDGSVLGHPFYLLAAAGATVVPVGAERPIPPSYDYNKLVRDKIPEIARLSGSSVRVFHATESEAVGLLRHKLLEECLEVMYADEQALVDELADLHEVLDALETRAGVSQEAIASARAEKARTRGTFDKLTYLEAATPGDAARESDSTSLPLLDPPTGSTLLQRSASPLTLLRVDERTFAFRVPIVPPLRRAVPLRQFATQSGDVRLGFTYTKSELEIKIESIEPRASVGQLSLKVEP